MRKLVRAQSMLSILWLQLCVQVALGSTLAKVFSDDSVTVGASTRTRAAATVVDVTVQTGAAVAATSARQHSVAIDTYSLMRGIDWTNEAFVAGDNPVSVAFSSRRLLVNAARSRIRHQMWPPGVVTRCGHHLVVAIAIHGSKSDTKAWKNLNGWKWR
jgi:hypothetical protein